MLENHPRGCVADLFDPLPRQWGLRGDPYLWEEMRGHLRDVPLPVDPSGLASLLAQTFEQLTGHALSEPGAIFLDRLSHGGMSSGRVSPEFWRDVAIPLLLSRCSS